MLLCLQWIVMTSSSERWWFDGLKDESFGYLRTRRNKRKHFLRWIDNGRRIRGSGGADTDVVGQPCDRKPSWSSP